MKGQSIKSRVSSLEKQIARLYKRLQKIRTACKHENFKESITKFDTTRTCNECGHVDWWENAGW